VVRVLKRAGTPASSIGRGNEPQERAILNARGKHSQAQLYHASPAQQRAWGVTGRPNRPGFSEHERRNRAGGRNPEWMQGVDSGPNTDENRRRVRAAAAFYGWKIVFPYDSVVEYHHWRFAKRPRPRNLRQRLHLVRERAALPKR
jgi:hypothetical protein